MINSTVSDIIPGQTITLRGSGFGSKSIPGPLVWDNFEGGSNGLLVFGNSPTVENMSGNWTWDDYTADTERPKYGDGRTRPNSTLSSKHGFTGDTYNNSLEIWHTAENTGDEIYFSFYYFYDKLSSNWSRNHKPWIVYGNTGYFPAAYDGWGNPTNGDGVFRNSVQDENGEPDETMWSDPNIDQIAGEWIRIEGFLKVSSPFNNNGAWKIWVHRPNASSPRISLEQSDSSYRTRSSSNYWEQWHFGTYHDNNTTNARADIYLDDIYFDITQARVEICDAPAWSGCTHHEIQIPAGWSDNSIDITVNQGSFSNGQDVFLYVVDSQGSANAQGYPVVLGGSSVTRPNPPTDLQTSDD